MAFEVPTDYFPPTLQVKFGFAIDRQWATVVTPSPSGPRQVRLMMTEPKRRLQGVVRCKTPEEVRILRDFLDDHRGNWKPFYIFNWYAQNYTADPKNGIIPTANLGALALTLPFKPGLAGTGSSAITGIYKNDVLTWTTGNFTVDTGGAGGEYRLMSTAGPTITTSDVVKVQATSVRERIPVAAIQNVDSFGFDWSAAVPPLEYALNVEEVF